MKRKAIIFLIAVTAFLSAFGGGSSLLAKAPNSADMEPTIQMQQNQAETPPILVAKKNKGGSAGGNSWGG